MNWYQVNNEADIFTPSILLYPDRIRENLVEMIRIAGEVNRLRTHVKTHKLAELIRMQLELGIRKFKCATLRELQLVVESGGSDVLVAYPLYGPALERYADMVLAHPEVKFASLVDHEKGVQALEKVAVARDLRLNAMVDVDDGMHRTGIAPGPAALELYRRIARSEQLLPAGLQVYDGHIHDTDFDQRKAQVERNFRPVQALIDAIRAEGYPLPEILCGGNPSFPVHALQKERSLSPGTCVLWDHGYASRYPDLAFQYGAVLATRVISKPGPDLLTLDLGHKAVGSEMPHPRVYLFDIGHYTAVKHSEEHLVIRTEKAADFSPGDLLYGVPMHICPTMALHEYVYVAQGHEVTGKWKVAARERVY